MHQRTQHLDIVCKVMKEQSLILKTFLPHMYIIDFGDVHRVKMAV